MLDRLLGMPKVFESSRKNFKYLYLCNKCKRSFDSKIELAQCKFCSHEVLELSRSPILKENNFRFYCAKCEKNFISSMPQGRCEICASKIIRFYTWYNISKHERIAFNIRRMIKFLRYSKHNEIKKEELPTK